MCLIVWPCVRLCVLFVVGLLCVCLFVHVLSPVWFSVRVVACLCASLYACVFAYVLV